MNRIVGRCWVFRWVAKTRALPIPARRKTWGLNGGGMDFCPLTVNQYLEILDRTGRQLAAGKRGAIDPELAPILERLGLQPSVWLDTIEGFDRWFRGAVGPATDDGVCLADRPALDSGTRPLPQSVHVTPSGRRI